MSRQGVTAEVHLERAQRHRKVGEALRAAGNEWSAVCYFYSAYHLVKNVLLADPVFDDPTALSQIHSTLAMDHRHTSSHHGRQRKGEPRAWGVNELVFKLYPCIYKEYERLHQASIAVRYEAGLRPEVKLEGVWQDIRLIADEHQKGSLVAAS